MSDNKHLATLRKHFRKHKHIPAYSQLLGLLWFKSKWGLSDLFRRLTEKWYFRKEGISFVPTDSFFTQKVYSSVKAGFPSPWDEENAHNIDLDTYLIPRPDSTVMIKVQGDSMIEAGINTGDIVIVDKGQQGKIDDIVVAEVDREFTLKYLKRDKRGYYLLAGNAKYPPFYPKEELKIFWVVTGVIRKYQK